MPKAGMPFGELVRSAEEGRSGKREFQVEKEEIN
jgi:hypothetical protein